jgi:hypothetical protein
MRRILGVRHALVMAGVASLLLASSATAGAATIKG